MGRPARAAVRPAAWPTTDAGAPREMHVKTPKGLWAGVGSFLRAFRGVGEQYVYRYVATFE